MADTTKLSDMLDAIINDKPEEAQIAFHDYLGGKMKEQIHGEETPETNNNAEED